MTLANIFIPEFPATDREQESSSLAGDDITSTLSNYWVTLTQVVKPIEPV